MVPNAGLLSPTSSRGPWVFVDQPLGSEIWILAYRRTSKGTVAIDGLLIIIFDDGPLNHETKSGIKV